VSKQDLEEVDEVDEREPVDLGQLVDGGARLVGARERRDTALVEREWHDRLTQLAVPQLQ